MKKLFSLFVVLMVSISLFAGGSGESASSEDGGAKAIGDYKIVLILPGQVID